MCFVVNPHFEELKLDLFKRVLDLSMDSKDLNQTSLLFPLSTVKLFREI